jgi:DivIVA domain-containing protein
MWDKFTDQARRVLTLGREEARRLNHNYLGTEHLLLGLLAEGEGIAAKVLSSWGIDLGYVRAKVEELIGRGGGIYLPEMTLTPRAKRSLELAYEESKLMGQNYIGTEHILLGLIREGEGVAVKILESLGITLEETRFRFLEILKAGGEILYTVEKGVFNKISPDDIRNKNFSKSFIGYDIGEVRIYLKQIAYEWEKLIEKSLELENKLEVVSNQNKTYIRTWNLTGSEICQAIIIGKEWRDNPDILQNWIVGENVIENVIRKTHLILETPVKWIASIVCEAWKENKEVTIEELWERFKKYRFFITAVCYGDEVNFARDYHCIIKMNDKVIQPLYVETQEIADKTNSWPKSPAYTAQNYYYFSTEDIPRNATIRIIIPEASKADWDVDLSKIL